MNVHSCAGCPYLLALDDSSHMLACPDIVIRVAIYSRAQGCNTLYPTRILFTPADIDSTETDVRRVLFRSPGLYFDQWVCAN